MIDVRTDEDAGNPGGMSNADLDAAIQAAKDDAAADKDFKLDPVDDSEVDSDEAGTVEEVPVLSKVDSDALAVEEEQVDTPGENPMGDFYEKEAEDSGGIPVEEVNGPVDPNTWGLPADAGIDSENSEVVPDDAEVVPDDAEVQEEEVDIPGENPLGEIYDEETGKGEENDAGEGETVPGNDAKIEEESDIDSLTDDVEVQDGENKNEPDLTKKADDYEEDKYEGADLDEEDVGVEPEDDDKEVDVGGTVEADRYPGDEPDVIEEEDSEDVLKEMENAASEADLELLKERQDDDDSLGVDDVNNKDLGADVLGGDDVDDEDRGADVLGGDDVDNKNHGADVLGGDDVDNQDHGADVLGGDDVDNQDHGADVLGGDDVDNQDHVADVLGGDDVDNQYHGADVLGGDDVDYQDKGADLLGGDDVDSNDDEDVTEVEEDDDDDDDDDDNHEISAANYYGEHDNYSPEAPFKIPANPFPDVPAVVS